VYKYAKTWDAIDGALSRSTHLKGHPTIDRIVKYMRQYPRDVEILEWNLVVCAGEEMLDDPKAPIWNAVLDTWHEERKRMATGWDTINAAAKAKEAV
jgi:hypothetical protein